MSTGKTGFFNFKLKNFSFKKQASANAKKIMPKPKIFLPFSIEKFSSKNRAAKIRKKTAATQKNNFLKKLKSPKNKTFSSHIALKMFYSLGFLVFLRNYFFGLRRFF